MSEQQTVNMAGLSWYIDEAHGVRVYLIDFGTATAYGFTAMVDADAEPAGLFVAVSQDLPAEDRHGVVHAMLTSWARHWDAAKAEDRITVSAVAPELLRGDNEDGFEPVVQQDSIWSDPAVRRAVRETIAEGGAR